MRIRNPRTGTYEMPPPDQQRKRSLWGPILFYLAWGSAVLFLLGSTINAFDTLDQIAREAARDRGQFRNLFAPARAATNVALILNLWVGLSIAWLLLLRVSFRSWGGLRRMAWGTVPLAMIVARPVVGGILLLLGAVGGVPIAPELAFVLAPFVLILTGILMLVVVFLLALLIFGFVVGIPVVLFNLLFDFERNIAVFRYQRDGLAGYLLRFYNWLAGTPPAKAAPDDSKGARFATEEEIAALANPEGMRFGYTSAGNPRVAQPLGLLTDKHILIQASTRSGKGTTLLIPHLLRYPGSAFVLDPKGENAKATGRTRATLNDKVHYLDPFGVSGKPRSRFNPLARFTPSNMEAESKALAAAFIMGQRDHWNASAQQLLAAMILYVYASPDIPAFTKDLITLRRLLLSATKETLEFMAESDLADGLLSDLAQSFLKTPEREFGSIVSTAQRETEILDNPYLIACLSAAGEGEEVSFSDWHTGTMTVFLCLSAPKFPTFNRWLRLVLTSALDEMTDRLRPPPLPVSFVLDELATLGHLDVVENAIGLAAGYGIQLVSIFQDVAQMRDLYKSRWASFIGNAGVRAVFNLDDFETADYWSRFMGTREIEIHNRSVDIYGYSAGENILASRRPLMAPEELMLTFAEGRMLILPQGERPIISMRVPYYDDPNLAGLWDDPRGLVPDIALPAPRSPPAAEAEAAAPETPPPAAEPPAESG